MKKTLLGLMLVVVSTSVMAEWILISETANYKIYVDGATLRKVGDKAKMWDLTDYHIGQKSVRLNARYWSQKRQVEYECEELQVRILALSRFSEPKGRGKVLYNGSGTSDWKPVAPDSVGYALWQIACGENKKKSVQG